MSHLPKLLLVIAVLMLVPALGVHAQTATPTPNPIAILPIPTLPWLPSPTYIFTATPFDSDLVPDVGRSEIYYWAATAAANVNALPQDISAPGGVPILVDENAQTFFAYGKWLFNSTRELVGATLSPIAISAFVAVSASIVIASIATIINFVTILVNAVLMLVRWLLKLIPGIGVFLMQIPYPPTPTPMSIPDGLAADSPLSSTFAYGNYNLWRWAPDSIAWWGRFGNAGAGIQIALIIMILVAGTFVLMRLMQRLRRANSGDSEAD
jgi:hypothetical protein